MRVLLILVLAHAAVSFDAFGLNIALPIMQEDLGMSATERQWVISAGALAVASLLPLAGRVTDRIGARSALIWSSAGFVLPLIALIVADSAWQVIACRTVQGAATALLLPATYSMTIGTFPSRRDRSFAIGALAVAGSVAAAAGSIVAGGLVDLASWRWVFTVVLVIMLGVLAGSIFGVTRRGGGYPASIDVLGTVTVTLGLFGIVYGFSRAGESGWIEPITVISLAAGVLLCVAFLIGQHRSARPLLPLAVFRDRDRAGSMVALFAVGFANVGTTLFLTLHMTLTLGFPSTLVGFAFVAQTIAQSIVTTVVIARGGHLVGPRLLIPCGMALWAGGAVWIAAGAGLAPDAFGAVILPAVITIGVGAGLLYSAVANAAILHLDHSFIGIASAVANSLPPLGGAVGAAILGAVSLDADGGSDFVRPLWVSAAVLLLGGAVAALLVRSGPLHSDRADHDDRPPRRRLLRAGARADRRESRTVPSPPSAGGPIAPTG